MEKSRGLVVASAPIISVQTPTGGQVIIMIMMMLMNIDEDDQDYQDDYDYYDEQNHDYDDDEQNHDYDDHGHEVILWW